MTASLAALVTLLEIISLVPMLDLFSPDEPIHSSLEKRPYMDKDPKDIFVCTRRSEKEILSVP